MATTSTGTLEGTLSKWTNVMKGWQYRFFVLDENAGLLSYYTSKEKMMKGVRRGCVRLKDAVIGIDDQEDNTFTITVDHKTFHFQAQHCEEREKWVRCLEDTIRRHANRGRLWETERNFYVSNYNNRDINNKRTNHLEFLAKRISEADAYLQLMIEQSNKVDQRIAEITDPEERAKCKILQDNTSAMLDHIKHSIVSLQIAKNMTHPINGIYNGPTATTNSSNNSIKTESNNEDEDDSITEDETITTIPPRKPPRLLRSSPGAFFVDSPTSTLNASATALDTPATLPHLQLPLSVDAVVDGIEFGTDCDANFSVDNNSMKRLTERLKSSPSTIGNVTTAPLALVMPETSYSSSEGEEDFYDANDDPFTSLGCSPVSCAARSFSVEASSSQENDAPETSQQGKTTPLVEVTEDDQTTTYNKASGPRISIEENIKSFRSFDSESIDYDAFYEEEEDTSISMESHGSMISHLLSQVKIGMDLTKVVLPTFILERRSLLEMYADYFAHPDLFVRIADLESPRERIVQVCRWYLSAYHAGRRSQVAKKPYNPILGEIFQCYWDIPGETKTDESDEIKDGPVPWCRANQLTFLAEQVSHHPPISAFYAEHYNKKISFSAHVWTKSKFLGLSVGVHNIGEGVVTLIDRSEEYFVTFPNGYGRSILTVPWVELGGSVEIRCPQTGYYGNIEFLTKPFYGGKRNKVTAEIYAPGEKKPFVSIAGEWTGLMEAKWHDKNTTEVFVDVNRIPIFKKQVRPIAEQADYESRRVWKEVTAGLKFNDIEKATNAKCEVEQKQREEAKMRKINDESWEHKFFKPVGENWIYTKPLSQRIYLQEKEAKR